MVCIYADNQQIYPVDNFVDKNIAINWMFFKAITLIICSFAKQGPMRFLLIKQLFMNVFFNNNNT